MRRLPPPELPDDERPAPPTEPSAGLVPPGRRPPTAVGTMRRPPHPPGSFRPGYYGHRLRSAERGSRLALAALLLFVTAPAAAAGAPADVLVIAGMVIALCAWAGLAGEDAGRSLRRRGRWLRLRIGRSLRRPALRERPRSA